MARCFWGLIGSLGLSLGYTAKAFAGLPELVLSVNQSYFKWQNQTFTLTQKNHPLFSTPEAMPWMRYHQVNLKAQENRGSYQFSVQPLKTCQKPRISSFTAKTSDFQFQGQFLDCKIAFTGEISERSLNHPGLKIRIHDPHKTSQGMIELPFRLAAQERIYGLGTPATQLNLRGHRWPLVVQEGGIGRGDPWISPLINLISPGSAGTPQSSYLLTPWLFSSSGWGAYLKSSAPAELDLSFPQGGQIRIFDNELEMAWVQGKTPLQLIAEYTRWSGRMRPLPDWFHRGAIIGMQGGTDRVRAVWKELKALNTPISAFWLQDWVGRRQTSIGSQLWWNWELDKERYPHWPELLADLKAAGIRVLGYLNPFLVDATAKGQHQRNLYQEALAKNLLVKNNQGQVYPIHNTDFSAGLLDLSSPDTQTWLKAVIQTQLIAQGFSGWMADYAEALPLDAILAQGDAWNFHNLYPEIWAKLNQSAIEEAGSSDELVFFTRSGYSRSAYYTPLFWQGDQMVTWDAFDGLHNALLGLLQSGLAGFPLNHSDIGGYTSISQLGLGWSRSPELLARWQELAAFTPVFRTHEGNQPQANAQFYDTSQSLAAFAQMAKIYAALFSYRKQLFAEAAQTGAPVVRPLFLHYPQDPEAVESEDQFLLGSEILVAPVLKPGQNQRRVYLPGQSWVHFWSGQTLGPGWVTVAAPLGQPAFFFKEQGPVFKDFTASLRRLGGSQTREAF